jgi:hypothetical protein
VTVALIAKLVSSAPMPIATSTSESSLSYRGTPESPAAQCSLSTSEQGQVDLLQPCVDAVASVNAVVTTGPSIDPVSVTASTNTQVVRYEPAPAGTVAT